MSTAFWVQEAKALLVRLHQVQPFTLQMPMVQAASISLEAQNAIQKMLLEGRERLQAKIKYFIRLVENGRNLSSVQKQAAFSLLKLQFNTLLDRLDIFADVFTQRSEHQTGIWLAGLDVLAKDALRLKKPLYKAPPLICFLDRGHGAAIRRARTRLPGGTFNPVAVIRVPRERMISSGIASSLVHEVGHQGAALLKLIPSLKEELRKHAEQDSLNQDLWQWYERWISEIVADFWGVASLGVGASHGLINVVSLPNYFVFRLNADDPHPPPWLRVQLSLAIGKNLYPDTQWDRLRRLWEELYPLQATSPEKQEAFRRLLALIPAFVRILCRHRNKALKGHRLMDIFPVNRRQAKRLRNLFQDWKKTSALIKKKQPALVLAVLGQARADELITPVEEYQYLVEVFQHWALNSQKK